MSTYRDVTRNQTQVKNLPQVHAFTFLNCDSLIFSGTNRLHRPSRGLRCCEAGTCLGKPAPSALVIPCSCPGL